MIYIHWIFIEALNGSLLVRFSSISFFRASGHGISFFRGTFLILNTLLFLVLWLLFRFGVLRSFSLQLVTRCIVLSITLAHLVSVVAALLLRFTLRVLLALLVGQRRSCGVTLILLRTRGLLHLLSTHRGSTLSLFATLSLVILVFLLVGTGASARVNLLLNFLLLAA